MLNILIVDDEVEIAQILQETLEDAFGVRSAYSVSQALDLVSQHKPDFILCDMTMPRQSGADFYKILATKHPGLQHRMIFMTGGTNNTEKQNFLKSIQNPVLEKPFVITTLLETLQAFAERFQKVSPEKQSDELLYNLSGELSTELSAEFSGELSGELSKNLPPDSVAS